MHAPRDLGLAGACAPREHTQPEGDVFEHRHVAKQCVVLKYEPDLALANAHVAGVLAVKQHLAGVRRFQPRDYPEQRGLARPRQPQQRDQLAGFDMQVDIVNRDEIAEPLADVSELDTHAATLIARSSCSCFTGTTRRSRKRLAMSVAIASIVSSDETANAAPNWQSLYRISTYSGIVFVCPRICPETTETAPNSPIARALHNTSPYSSPHLTLGIVTRKNICHPPAPSTIAASSSSLPTACMIGMSSRAASGNVTKSVASTIPGSAKITLMP